MQVRGCVRHPCALLLTVDSIGTRPSTASDVLFPEPATPRTTQMGWGEPRVHWLSECTTPDAVSARATVNAWYDDFPDHGGRLAQHLRSTTDVAHLQALDELFVHHLLRQRHQDVRYEEGGVGPDFRVYQGGRCVLAVEVATQFLKKDWKSDHQRHNRLIDEVNRRVRPTHGYFVSLDIAVDSSEPAPNHFARWLVMQLESLPPHSEVVDNDPRTIPIRAYEHNGARVTVRFLAMKTDARAKVDPDARIVGIGKPIFGYVNSGERLKNIVSDKGGDRYHITGIPYVVAVGNRDEFLSDDQVLDGLYGSTALVVGHRDPSQATLVERNDGLFAYDGRAQRRRHRRISAVALFGAIGTWDPSSVDVALYENPEPALPLDDGLFPAGRRFGFVSEVTLGWRASHPE